MTIAQAEKFYEQDAKDYEIEKNKDFLKWLRSTINNGYHCFIEIAELQKLIDNIVIWYEFKYPERELEYFEGITYTNFQDIKSISDILDIKQLLFRLPRKQLCLMECGYRAKGWGQHPIHEDGKLVGWQSTIFMRINRKRKNECNLLCENMPYFLLRADQISGKVSKDYDLEEFYDNEEDINLTELLLLFNKKYNDKLDFTELKECIYDHDCDIELRHRVLRLIALKLLYSRNTTPERGYERAKKFINEFASIIDNTLSTEEINIKMHVKENSQNHQTFVNHM